MKKNLLLLAFSLLCSVLQAQSLKDLLLHMPQQVCPVLSEYNRLELVDNQRNGKPMQTRNLLQSVSSIDVLTDDYAHLRLSVNSEKTFALLPTNNGNAPIICVISTVSSDSITDSSLSFYTTDWTSVPATDHFDEPTSTDFRNISFDASTRTLTVNTYTPFTLQTDGSQTPVPVHTTTATFQWNGLRFWPTSNGKL